MQPQLSRKSSNISNVNATDDLQLAISKILPNAVDFKPQVRIKYSLSASIHQPQTPFFFTHLSAHKLMNTQPQIPL